MSETGNKERWWFPQFADGEWASNVRGEYDEAADMDDDEIIDEYNDGRKFVTLWDHVGDAYEDYEPLADAYLELRVLYQQETGKNAP